jgi:ATP-binding cassette subfamily B protein
MDRVVYLEEGRVVAIGTHEELIASCPDYANLVQLQRLEDEIGGKNS